MSTDTYRFDVVHKGTWYMLGSLSDHIHAKVDPDGDLCLLLTNMYRPLLVPKREVSFPCTQTSLPRRSIS